MENISKFLLNIKNESSEDISDFISYQGEKVLECPESLNLEVSKILSQSIPFSYPYLKKIIEDEKLMALYSNVLKKEGIDDLEIANLFVKNNLLNFDELNDNLIEIIVSTDLNEDLLDYYFNLIKNKDLLKHLSTNLGNLGIKYVNYFKINNFEQFSNSKIGYQLMTNQERLSFLSFKINKDVESEEIDLKKLSEQDFVVLLSKIEKSLFSRFSFNMFMSRYNVDASELSTEIYQRMLASVEDDMISELLELQNDSKELEALIKNLILTKRKIKLPDSKNIKNMGFLIKSEFPVDLLFQFLDKKLEDEGFDYYLGKLFKENDIERITLVLTEYKDYIEQNKIFFVQMNSPEFKGIISYNPIYKLTSSGEITKDEISNAGFYLKMEILPFLKEELFSFAVELIKDYPEQLAIHDLRILNETQQKILFNELSVKTKLELFDKFDKLTNDYLLKAVDEWFNDDFISFSMDDKTFELIFENYLDKLTDEQIMKVINNLSRKPKNIDKIKFLFSKIESDDKLIKSIFLRHRFRLIEDDILPDNLFSKACLEFCHDNKFWKAVVLNEKYYNLVPVNFKKYLSSTLDSIKDLSQVNKVIEIIEWSEQNVLFYSVNKIFLDHFYKNDVFFKNQDFVGNLSFYNGDSLRYALSYLTKDKINLKALEKIEINSDNIEIIFSLIKEISIENNNFLVSFIKEGITSENKEIKDFSKKIIIDQMNDSFLNIISEKELFSDDIIVKILFHYNSNEPTYELKKIFSKIFERNVFPLEKAVEIATSRDLFDIIHSSVKNNNQLERKYVRYLRKFEKKEFLPEDYFVVSDILENHHDWSFYNKKFDNSIFKLMSNLQQETFYKNLITSFDENSDFINFLILEKYKIDKDIVRQIYNKIDSNKLYDFLNKGLTSINKDVFLDAIKSNLKKIEEIDKDNAELYILIYKLGIKEIFSLKLKIDLSDSDLITFLNETSDLNLLKMYSRKWKELNLFVSRFSSEIALELSKTVTISDVIKENIYFERGIFVFEIKGIVLVKTRVDKKTGKFLFIDGYRKDLLPKVKSLFKDLTENNPEKIVGYINLSSKKFIPKNNDFKNKVFEINDESLEKIEYMKSLNVEGSIKGIAKRDKNFNYIVDVMFEESLKIGTREIEKEIRRKTFNINKKLEDLLKISPKRQFGFELELGVFNKNRTEVAKILEKNGFDINVSFNYGKSNGKKWDFKEDSSLSTDALEQYNEDTDEYDVTDGDVFEIASPILKGKEGISEAKRFLNKLFKTFDVISGQSVNAGLHVHHDISDIEKLELDSEEILKSYLPFQETLYSLVDENRSEPNEYCTKIDPERLQAGRNLSSGTTGVLFSKFGTLEFRMKEGVTDTKEIINWIVYTQKIVDAMYFKLNYKVKMKQDSLEKLSQASIYMVLESLGDRRNVSDKIKSIRKLVGFQEKLYAQI